MYEIKPGMGLPMRSMTVYPIEDASFTFKAPKGKQFVCLFMGVEDKADDGKKLDINEWLRAAGWVLKEEIEEAQTG